MTEEEQKKAWSDYLKFREQHAYCKSYRQLKAFYKENKRKMVFYQFPVGEKMSNYLREISSLGHRKPKRSVTQSLTKEDKEHLQNALNKK